MLGSVFAKTIYEKRLATVLWFLAIFLTTVLIGVLFPTFRDALGQTLNDVPESLEKFLGEASSYQSLGGYVDIQVINQMIFYTIIMAVVLGTSLMAGDESSGTLQTLLANPVKRTTVYFHKLLALLIMLAVGSSGIFFGVWASGLIISESMDWGSLAQATLMLWLASAFIGILSFSVGAISGKKSLAGIAIGSYAFIAYMVTGLAGTATALKTADYFSAFHYFNNPSVIANGLNTRNILVLTTASIFFTALGWLLFRSRDIYIK